MTGHSGKMTANSDKMTAHYGKVTAHYEFHGKSVTIKWNGRSSSRGMSGHFEMEWVVTLPRNTQ